MVRTCNHLKLPFKYININNSGTTSEIYITEWNRHSFPWPVLFAVIFRACVKLAGPQEYSITLLVLNSYAASGGATMQPNDATVAYLNVAIFRTPMFYSTNPHYRFFFVL